MNGAGPGPGGQGPPQPPKPEDVAQRGVKLNKLVAVVTETILEQTANLQETMFIVHKVQDEVLFRAMTQVMNKTIDVELQKLTERLVQQGMLHNHSGRPI